MQEYPAPLQGDYKTPANGDCSDQTNLNLIHLWLDQLCE